MSALGRPYSGYYPRIAAKGSALLEAIIRNHAFVDANKRTAALLLLQLLDRSGYRLAPLPGEDLSRALEEIIVATAARARDRAAIEAWLAPRVIRKG